MAGRTCERGFCTATPAIQTRCRLRQAPSGIHRESAKLDSLRVGRSFPEAHQPTIQHVPAKTKDKGGTSLVFVLKGSSFNRVFGKRSASGQRRDPCGQVTAVVWGCGQGVFCLVHKSTRRGYLSIKQHTTTDVLRHPKPHS